VAAAGERRADGKMVKLHVDRERIHSAIVAAEARTTGRIHVTVSHQIWGSTHSGAERIFTRLHLRNTPQRNGVLFFVVPDRREFTVLGDVGIHEQVGQEFWDRVVNAMSDRIKAGNLTDGILHGIQEAGSELAQHFPK
jgi:uncharacterized membrane protein